VRASINARTKAERERRVMGRTLDEALEKAPAQNDAAPAEARATTS